MIFDAFLRKTVSQREAEKKERKKARCERERERERDGQIDTNWERDDAARFRGRESSMVLRKNNNVAFNYQLVSLICCAACTTVIRTRVECRSSAAADLFQCILAETMAPEIVSEIIQITETRWKYCLVHNFLRQCDHIGRRGAGHTFQELSCSLFPASSPCHLSSDPSHPLDRSHFSTDRRDFLPQRSDILTVILTHCFYKGTLLSSSPGYRKELGWIGVIFRRKFKPSAEKEQKHHKFIYYIDRICFLIDTICVYITCKKIWLQLCI